MGNMVYEVIGAGYAQHGKADPRLIDRVLRHLALPRGSRILDVGAGTGNYAMPLAAHGYRMIALEPSGLMRRQSLSTPGVQWLAGTAEDLPLGTGAAHGVICMLALHHMRSVFSVVHEMRRVMPNGPLVIFTFDPRLSEPWWFDTYFASIWHEAFRLFPPIDDVIEEIHRVADHSVEVAPFMLPADLVDQFTAAGWRRPEIYLNPTVRAGMSAFALADQAAVEVGVAHLAHDLASGNLRRQFSGLLQREVFDPGYRFLVVR